MAFSQQLASEMLHEGIFSMFLRFYGFFFFFLQLVIALEVLFMQA